MLVLVKIAFSSFQVMCYTKKGTKIVQLLFPTTHSLKHTHTLIHSPPAHPSTTRSSIHYPLIHPTIHSSIHHPLIHPPPTHPSTTHSSIHHPLIHPTTNSSIQPPTHPSNHPLIHSTIHQCIKAFNLFDAVVAQVELLKVRKLFQVLYTYYAVAL